MGARGGEPPAVLGRVHVSMARDARRPYGVCLRHDRLGIVIDRVCEGSVLEQWNAQNPRTKVSGGDRLLAVNGVEVDPTWECWVNVVAEFRKPEVHALLFLSPSRRLRRPLPWRPRERILSEELIDQLLNALKGVGAGEECAICLDDVPAGGEVVRLRCGHVFHRDCSEQWLRRCPTPRFARCPTCRGSMVPEALDCGSPVTEEFGGGSLAPEELGGEDGEPEPNVLGTAREPAASEASTGAGTVVNESGAAAGGARARAIISL